MLYQFPPGVFSIYRDRTTREETDKRKGPDGKVIQPGTLWMYRTPHSRAADPVKYNKHGRFKAAEGFAAYIADLERDYAVAIQLEDRLARWQSYTPKTLEEESDHVS